MEIDRIYNDDCYKAIKNIPDKSIDCVYVDIPYKYNMQKRELTNLKSQDLSCKRYNNELIDCNLAGGGGL